MRLDHFATAAQQLDCGFDRHHYPPDSFGSASSSKAEQVTDTCAQKAILKEHLFVVLLQFTASFNPCLSPPDFVPAVPHQWEPRRCQDQPLNSQLRHRKESNGTPGLRHGDW